MVKVMEEVDDSVGSKVFLALFLSPTCDGNVRPRLLLPPRGDKHGDISVASVQEVVDCQLDSQTGEDFLVSVAKSANKWQKKICENSYTLTMWKVFPGCLFLIETNIFTSVLANFKLALGSLLVVFYVNFSSSCYHHVVTYLTLFWLTFIVVIFLFTWF